MRILFLLGILFAMGCQHPEVAAPTPVLPDTTKVDTLRPNPARADSETVRRIDVLLQAKTLEYRKRVRDYTSWKDRHSLESHAICIVFDSMSVIGTPAKLYYTLTKATTGLHMNLSGDSLVGVDSSVVAWKGEMVADRYQPWAQTQNSWYTSGAIVDWVLSEQPLEDSSYAILSGRTEEVVRQQLHFGHAYRAKESGLMLYDQYRTTNTHNGYVYTEWLELIAVGGVDAVLGFPRTPNTHAPLPLAPTFPEAPELACPD